MRKIDLASAAQLVFVFKKFFPDATDDKLNRLLSEVKPKTRSVAELQGHFDRFRNSADSALDNLGLMSEDRKNARPDFFELVASIGLHRLWYKFAELNIHSLDDLKHLEHAKPVLPLDVEFGCYFPKIAERFTRFCKEGWPSVANLAIEPTKVQMVVFLAKHFGASHAEAEKVAQSILDQHKSISTWQLHMAVQLCPLKLDRLVEATTWVVKTKKDKRSFAVKNRSLDMKTWCWRAGLYSVHTKFANMSFCEVFPEPKNKNEYDFTKEYSVTSQEAVKILLLATACRQYCQPVRIRWCFVCLILT